VFIDTRSKILIERNGVCRRAVKKSEGRQVRQGPKPQAALPDVSLEDAFWRGLKEIAAARKMTLSGKIAGLVTAFYYGPFHHR
jgi:predicted DNA-binding ribbon-helix-helix protein